MAELDPDIMKRRCPLQRDGRHIGSSEIRVTQRKRLPSYALKVGRSWSGSDFCIRLSIRLQ